jgi:hypothetical protein
MKLNFHAARLSFAGIGGALWLAGDILTAFKKYLEQQLHGAAQATSLDTLAGVLFIVSSVLLMRWGHRHRGLIAGRSFSFLGLVCLIVSSGFSENAWLSTLSLMGMTISCVASIVEAWRDEKKQKAKQKNVTFPQLIPMLPSLICNIGYLIGAVLKQSLPEIGVGALWLCGTLLLALSQQKIKLTS